MHLPRDYTPNQIGPPPRVGDRVWDTTTLTLHNLAFLHFSTDTVRAEHFPFRAGENRVWNRVCRFCRAHHLPYGFRARAFVHTRVANDAVPLPSVPVSPRDTAPVFDATMSSHAPPRCVTVHTSYVPSVPGANGSNRCDAYTPHTGDRVAVMTRHRGSEVHFPYFTLQVLILSITNSLCRTFALQPTNRQLRQTLPSQNPSYTETPRPMSPTSVYLGFPIALKFGPPCSWMQCRLCL